MANAAFAMGVCIAWSAAASLRQPALAVHAQYCCCHPPPAVYVSRQPLLFVQHGLVGSCDELRLPYTFVASAPLDMPLEQQVTGASPSHHGCAQCRQTLVHDLINWLLLCIVFGTLTSLSTLVRLRFAGHRSVTSKECRTWRDRLDLWYHIDMS
jgi:hypothetical protein